MALAQDIIHIVNGPEPHGPDEDSIDSAFFESDSDEDSMQIPPGEVAAGTQIPLDQMVNYFRYRQGRRWNKQGAYLLPAESKPEGMRLENQHRLCYTILDKRLFLNTVQFPESGRILDVGTSSGIWAIEMAEKYPKATVVGLDISPQQTGQPIPPNCSFVFHDILKEPLPFPDNSFDFVHIRDMQSAITIPWDGVICEINRVLAPGGYAQFAEFIYEHICLSPNPIHKRSFSSSAVKIMEFRFVHCAAFRGTTVFKRFTLTELLKRTGNWTDPKELFFTVPIGLWGKRHSDKFKGGQMLTNLLDGLNSFGAAFLESTGDDRDSAQRFITSVNKQYKASHWCMAMDMMYCVVQKVK